MAGAPIGNQNNKKWKTPKERRAAFAAVCAHLEAGFSKNSFPLADWETVEAYCREYPIDFVPEKLADAMRVQMMTWERIGIEGAKGELAGFSAAAWIFNMKNRFSRDWRDRQELEHSGGMDHKVSYDEMTDEQLRMIAAGKCPPKS